MTKATLAKALFEPDSIMLIGASSDLSKPGGRPLKFLQDHGYRGRIYPVNPRADTIGGLQCYPDIGAVRESIDHAFIMLAGDAAVEAVEQCAAAGAVCATVLAGGFAEAGDEGDRRQAELVATARDNGIRLLGPNSIGVINAAAGVALSANAMLELPELNAGRTAVISQSGSMIGALLSHGEARKVHYSKLISVGNEADLSVGEIGDLLIEDDATDVILLFLETLRDAERITAFARHAHEAGKPVIAYKLGRSSLGQKLARSHTGALAGSDETIAAFLAHNGIARVSMLDSLIEAPRLFGGRTPLDVTTKPGRVGVISTTGGGGAMVVDNLGLNGIDVALTPKSVSARLADHGIIQEPGRMVDLTMAGAKPEIVQGVIADMMAAPDIDAVVMVVGSSARFHPNLAVKPLLDWTGAAKPLAVYLAPEAQASLLLLAEAGIAVFRAPEACADGLHALLTWTPPKTLPACEPVPTLAALDGERVVAEAKALTMFAAMEITVAVGEVVENLEGAQKVASRLGYPIALKIASPDIAHKSDAGGVRIDIGDGDELARAYGDIINSVGVAHPDADIDGVLVQKMHSGLGEALLGFKRDPLVGPVIVLGLGGILAELYHDTALRLAPVDIIEAQAMIDEVIGLAPLRGYRNAPPGDMQALAQAIVDFSNFAREKAVLEAEINPLVVGAEGHGVVAVDGLIICGAAG